jgi:hypothetical protein
MTVSSVADTVRAVLAQILEEIRLMASLSLNKCSDDSNVSNYVPLRSVRNPNSNINLEGAASGELV